MIFDSKKDGIQHLESMRGDEGNIIDLYDEVVLQLPNRKERYKAELKLEHSVEYESVFKIKRLPGDKWLLMANRNGVWIKL